VTVPADRWLERILATPCAGHAPAGKPCWEEVGQHGDRNHDYVCASRIQAAEEAGRLRPQQYHRFPRMDITWQHGRWTKACERCGALTSGERGQAYCSHDNGATWHPGPDACPGRTTPRTKET
jgi:hypothetical protein